MNKLITTLSIILIALTGMFVLHPQATNAQLSDRIRYVIWNDTNCNGIREAGEALVPNISVVLRWAGSNGVIDATDREIAEFTSITGEYRFDKGAAGEPYFMSIRSDERASNPALAGIAPTKFRVGNDPSRDSDLRNDLLPGTDLWATPVFTMPADGSIVVGQDIGLCNPANLVLSERLYLPLLSQ